jgi:hypothetical protein
MIWVSFVSPSELDFAAPVAAFLNSVLKAFYAHPLNVEIGRSSGWEHSFSFCLPVWSALPFFA